MKNLKVMIGTSFLMLIMILSCQKDRLPDPQINNQIAKTDSTKTLSVSVDSTKQTVLMTTDTLNIDTKAKSIQVDYLKTFSSKAGDSDYFILKSNTHWKIASYPSWVTVSPLSGSGNANVTVTVKENTGAQRTGSIAITGTGVLHTASITAIQLANSVPSGTLTIDYLKTFSSVAGDNDYFLITTNTSWKIASSPSWVTISPLSGTGNTKVTVTVQANTGAQRTGTITISGTGIVQNASINALQVAASVPAVVAPPITTGNLIQVTNPGNNNDIRPNIQTAFNNAKDGDLIVIPAGTFKFTGSVVTSKKISLKGQGKTNTILYRDPNISDASMADRMFEWDINSDSPCGVIISDICIKSKAWNGPNRTKADHGFYIVNAVDFIISNCRIENFGFAGVNIRHKDRLARGLVCNNEFVHNTIGNGELTVGYGVVVYGADLEYAPTPTLGSSNFIFIEDNYFDYHWSAIESTAGALYVARYNTIVNGFIMTAIGTHPARNEGVGSGGNFGTRACEIYNNNMDATKFGDGASKGQNIASGHKGNELFICATSLQGGDAVLFNNVYKGYHVGCALRVQETYFGDTTYPTRYQGGYLSGLAHGLSHTGTGTGYTDGDYYIWNNDLTQQYSGYSLDAIDNWSPKFLVEGRDYHLSAKPGYTPYTYPHPLKLTIK